MWAEIGIIFLRFTTRYRAPSTMPWVFFAWYRWCPRKLHWISLPRSFHWATGNSYMTKDQLGALELGTVVFIVHAFVNRTWWFLQVTFVRFAVWFGDTMSRFRRIFTCKITSLAACVFYAAEAKVSLSHGQLCSRRAILGPPALPKFPPHPSSCAIVFLVFG